ncbi:MAG: InlB B-repeat-containing protein [Clostridiales bacterium]|jgi:uncharacterized repeat protein (TIGR02543 family)|nr:InlB B-repeat-containing protein [Clostridiales bacterium]
MKKNKLSIVLLSAVLALACFAVAACGDKAGESTEFTVKFVTNADVSFDDVKIPAGEKATAPTDIARPGYALDGWFGDENFSDESRWNFAENAVTGDITLYAKWTAVVYTIEYNLNGGANNADNPPSYTVESADITLRAPTKQGYDFAGWYASEDFEGSPIASITKGTTDNFELWAKWTPPAVPASVTVAGDSIVTRGGTAVYTATVLPSGVSQNVTWSVAPADLAEITSLGVLTATDIGVVTVTATASGTNVKGHIEVTVTAPPATTVTYNLNDDEYTKAVNTENSTASVDLPAVIKAPTRDLFTFGGWYTDSGLMAALSATEGGYTLPAGTAPTVTLYAKWTYDYPYFITGKHTGWKDYPQMLSNADSGNEGKEANALWPVMNPDRTNIERYAPKAPVLLNNDGEGAGFKVISLNANGTDTVWHGEDGSTDGGAGNVVMSHGSGYYRVVLTHSGLVPTAAAVMQTLTFTSQSHVTWTNAATTQVLLGSAFTDALKAYTVAVHYEYATEPTVTVTGVTDGVVMGDVTVSLSAAPTAKVYTITYHNVTDDDHTNQKTYTVESSSITLTDPTARADYTFGGWYGNEGFTGDKMTSIITSGGDLNIYAKWDAIGKINVTYVLDDGASVKAENGAGNSTVYDVGVSVTIADPSRTHYTFDGWYKESDFTEPLAAAEGGGGSVLPTASADSVTLYAKWTYDYPYFVSGAHTSWSDYAAMSALTAEEKEVYALYPFVTGTGDSRVWDGKTFKTAEILMTAGNTFKVIGDGGGDTTWYNVGDGVYKEPPAGETANAQAEFNGYYVITFTADSGANAYYMSAVSYDPLCEVVFTDYSDTAAYTLTGLDALVKISDGVYRIRKSALAADLKINVTATLTTPVANKVLSLGYTPSVAADAAYTHSGFGIWDASAIPFTVTLSDTATVTLTLAEVDLMSLRISDGITMQDTVEALAQNVKIPADTVLNYANLAAYAGITATITGYRTNDNTLLWYAGSTEEVAISSATTTIYAINTANVYLKLVNNSNDEGWKSANARIALYTGLGNTFHYNRYLADLDMYVWTAPASDLFIFVRLNPSGEFDWTSKWAQTVDLNLNVDGKRVYTITGWGNIDNEKVIPEGPLHV